VTKSRRNLARWLLVLPLAGAAFIACGGDETTGNVEPAASIAGYEDVELYGEVNDEALIAFAAALSGGSTVDASRAAVVDFPVEGGMVPKDPIPQFTWHFGGTSAIAPDAPPASLAELVAPRLPEAPSWGVARVFDWLAIRAAHAHGAPFNGRATFLTFATADEPKLVRILTSQTVYQPSLQTWAKFTGATGPITVTLVSADFEQSRIILDGGPITGGTATFTVTP